MLRLCTLGGCFLERNGTRVESVSGNRKGLALLALIAAAGDRGVARDTAVALLWPDSDEERARTSLRQLLHSLRNQLAAPELLLPSPELRLNPAVIDSDVVQFRAAFESRDYAAAVSWYRGAFLDGFFLRGSDEFERWVATERGNLAGAAAQALEKMASDADASGDPGAAVEHWRALAKAEPHSARAAIGLMRALDARGERAAALQHARVYELMMREEFGDVPDSAVMALADELRAAPVRRDAPGPAAAIAKPYGADSDVAVPTTLVTHTRKHRRSLRFAGAALLIVAVGFALVRLAGGSAEPVSTSIAVLPFANISGDANDEVIADGLTENLIATLASVSDLRVIARTSAFVFKKRVIDLRAIADSLGVGTIVDGSVQRVGDDLKVNVQLVNAADATVLWASTYNRELKEILVVQEEISAAIVDALSARLRARSSDGGPRVARDGEAYELYLRGRHLFTATTDRESTARAQRYFQQALQRDSTIAHAHAGLADVYTRLGIFGFAPAQMAYAAGKAEALRALELDRDLGEAYATLGHLKCVAEFDWAGAVRDFEKSIALSPNYTFGRMPYAVCLASMGRFRDALKQLGDARSFDPLSAAVPNMLGRVHNYMREPDQALVYLQQALELSPNMDLAYQQTGHAYLQKGMAPQAVAALRRAAELSGARDSLHLAYAFARSGDAAAARRIADGIAQSSSQSPALSFHLAMAYTGLGDFDQAFAWLQRGLRDRVSFMVGTAVEPAFEPLHKDERWKKLIDQMGLDAK